MTNPGRVIALDVGDVRIGVAVTDPTRTIAQPVEVYRRVGYGPDSRYVKGLCERYGTTEVLLGLPLNMPDSFAQDTAILIPSYQPDGKLPPYVRALLEAGFAKIVVVDDGSGEAYDPIFQSLYADAGERVHAGGAV